MLRYEMPYQSLFTFAIAIWNDDHITWNFLLFELQNWSFINTYMLAECVCDRSYLRRGAIYIQSSFGILSLVILFTRQINTLLTLHQWFEVLWLLRVPDVSCVFVFCDMFPLFSYFLKLFLLSLSWKKCQKYEERGREDREVNTMCFNYLLLGSRPLWNLVA